jgi:hypothetical protein
LSQIDPGLLAPDLLVEGRYLFTSDEGGFRYMADGEGSGAGNFVWAIALIIIVAIIAAVVMSGGYLTGGGDKKIDVDIKTPAR